MKNIAEIKDCFGCGLCAKVCAHEVIDIRLNENGFYQPYITDPAKCVECGLCIRVCSFINHSGTPSPVRCYAGWSKDEGVRMTSTSGGVSYEIARHLMDMGYGFCGVRYNSDKHRAEHYIAEKVEDLHWSKGSKYLPSYTLEAFAKINSKKRYMVVGTPCQIASFRNYTELFRCKDNFLLVDFFCHGVPSNLLWEKYLTRHGSCLGKISSATWRNKDNGWRRSYCVTLEGEEKAYRSSGRDEFYTMFLGDACLGKACYSSCRFKSDKSCADIRIGDFWGERYKDEHAGVNAVVTFTERGDRVLKESGLELKEYSFAEVSEGQMVANAEYPWFYPLVMKGLGSRFNFLPLMSGMMYLYRKLKSWR